MFNEADIKTIIQPWEVTQFKIFMIIRSTFSEDREDIPEFDITWEALPGWTIPIPGYVEPYRTKWPDLIKSPADERIRVVTSEMGFVVDFYRETEWRFLIDQLEREGL